MFTIRYTVNGQPFNSVDDPLRASMLDQFKVIFKNKLSQFGDRLDASTLTIDVDHEYQLNVFIENVPYDIKEEVEKALYE